MNKKHVLYILLIVLSICSCDRINFLRTQDQTLLATVGEKEFYFEDLDTSLFKGITKSDSLSLLNAYVNNWVKKELKIKESSLNLSNKQLEDIERKIEDYRTSLLTFNYDRALAAQVDTLVTKAQINNYYNENMSQFKLIGPIVKAKVILYDKDSKKEKKYKELLKSTSKDAAIDLVDMSKKDNLRIYDFSDNWYYFNEILNVLPFSMKNFDLFLKNHNSYEITEGETTYFLKVISSKLTGAFMPINMAENSIKTAILNERRKNHIKEMEDSLFIRSIREGVTIIEEIDTVSSIKKDSIL